MIVFSQFRAQLLNAGLHEDGYQAIEFALNNVPFRDSPFVAKNIILITDEGRTTIPDGAGIKSANNFLTTHLVAVLIVTQNVII